MTDQGQLIGRIGSATIHDDGPGLLSLSVTLSRTPSPQWYEAFHQLDYGVERTTFMRDRGLLVWTNTVSVSQAWQEDVGLWFTLIDAKIAGANHYCAQRTRSGPATQDPPATEAQARADVIAHRFGKS